MHLDAQKERAQGHEVDMPSAPFEYVVLDYRRKMRMTYEEVRSLPANRLLRDLEMMDLEAAYGPRSIKSTIPSKGSVQ